MNQGSTKKPIEVFGVPTHIADIQKQKKVTKNGKIVEVFGAPVLKEKK